jgi:hypothetical protein
LPSLVEEEGAPRRIEDIHEFLALVDLSNIVVHEERSRRIHWAEAEIAKLEFPLSENTLATQTDGRSFRFRYRMVFADQNAEFVADIEAVYDSSELVEIGNSLTADFASRVAFMAAYPFLRSSIFYSAHRLGLPAPLLAMVRQGEFSIGADMPQEEVQRTFAGARSELVPSELLDDGAYEN